MNEERGKGARERERKIERGGYMRGYDDVHDYRDGCESEFYSLILFFFFLSLFFLFVLLVEENVWNVTSRCFFLF